MTAAARLARRARRAAPAVPVALALAVLPACGSDNDIRGWLGDHYSRTGTQADTVRYTSAEPVDRTVAAIANGIEPAARASDKGTEYLRFADDIVIVSAAARGSTVRVEDLDDAYRRGQYAFLGSGFTPGSPAGDDGGPGDGK
ncbi:DUF4247 domain-containing protein [Frankia sp. CNm7]|uniref:DUF4247 domain-containing protein n=1 Tax=Frankia nepalensis TaxID=1836974 RepID=A0A937R9T2_9ACTN|nr:DUF4247 domain-containing protein [Frankia nepalensis]MBL7501794.1 DUF4247 domain-containing protein [Frankia nepalensis]MBL7513890.1 DUF4247 domain-containing protein [Frankia nepalensis]MBL7523974.1 DUF4247 domain-containing protein [Frankia nepalensis]MBL7626362.1 DUF4247 domain-containing protein [Frankia nepalensis]